MGEGDFQSTVDSVSTAMLCLNNRICLLKFSVPQEARWENNYLGKVSTEWQLSWSEYLDKSHSYTSQSTFDSQALSSRAPATLFKIPAHWDHLRL